MPFYKENQQPTCTRESDEIQFFTRCCHGCCQAEDFAHSAPLLPLILLLAYISTLDGFSYFFPFFFPSTPFLNINLTPKCRNPATLHCVIPRTRGYIKDALLHLFRLHPSILYYTTTTITRSLPSLIPTAQCCKKKKNPVFFFLLLMPLLLASGFNCKPSLLIFHLPTFTISIHHS